MIEATKEKGMGKGNNGWELGKGKKSQPKSQLGLKWVLLHIWHVLEKKIVLGLPSSSFEIYIFSQVAKKFIFHARDMAVALGHPCLMSQSPSSWGGVCLCARWPAGSVCRNPTIFLQMKVDPALLGSAISRQPP